jgi:SAM-dependent methyltransferase
VRSGTGAGIGALSEHDLPDAVFTVPRRWGFCTELVGATLPSPDDAWMEAQRVAARRGCAIERLVVVGDRSLAHDGDVSRLRQLDQLAGVETRVVAARDVFATGVELPRETLRYSLWDGELWCGKAGPGEHRWRLSTVASDLRAARAATAALRRVPDVVLGAGAQAALEEPLLEAASVARRLAAVLCPGIDGKDCSALHGLWPYLRILGLAADPNRHRAFFDAALGTLAGRGGFGRVLVSGAADQGMLARVASAYAAASAPFDGTVVDVCGTPLALVNAYAQRCHLSVRTLVADARDFAASQPFDVVCTHSLLPNLPVTERPRLVERWARLLRRDGKLVTVTRIDPEGTSSPAGPSQAHAFGEQVRREAVRWRDLLEVSPDDLGAAAQRYAASTIVHAPPRSTDEVVNLLERAGFAVERLEVKEVAGPSGGRDAAPATARTAVYAELVASRR